MTKPWPMVPLGEVLKKSEEWMDLKPEETYREVTVRLWGKGVVLRREVTGAEIAASRRLVVRRRQFILSRIDARNGAFGLIPDSLDKAIVSNDFPVFNLHTQRIEPTFLEWMSRANNFVALCKAASEGTTNRVRLKAERFLASQIPLPPLPEQKRIVVRIEELASKIEEARGLRQKAVEEAAALADAALSHVFIDKKHSHWEYGPISQFADINPSRRGLNLAPADLVSFVPMKAVHEKTGTITQAEVRPYVEVSKGYTWFADGDVVFARITPCMQNGKAALARNLMNKTGFGSTEFHVMRPFPDVLGEWLLVIVRSKAFRDDAATHFTGTAGQQRVPQSFLQQKTIPVPPLSEQRSIVAYLDDLHAKVDALKRLQAETAVEINAMLPSVLDKAFKGEM